MTQNELNRFRTILTAMVAELERFIHHREGITVERSADQLEETQAASQQRVGHQTLNRVKKKANSHSVLQQGSKQKKQRRGHENKPNKPLCGWALV